MVGRGTITNTPLTCDYSFGTLRSIVDPFTPDQIDYLARYLARTFISRKDVKAEQMPFHKGSAYRPIREPWKMDDLRAHVRGDKTFGHYLLDQDSMVKFLAFDIDLEKQGTYCDFSYEAQEYFLEYICIRDGSINDLEFHHFNPREAWLDHSHPARPWMTYQLTNLASSLSRATGAMGLKTFATCSGSKGAHVYGIFDEPVQAEVARAVAMEILINAPGRGFLDGNLKFVQARGQNFYHLAPDWEAERVHTDHLLHFDLFDNFMVEVFPKQDRLEGNRLGNLMRLDFGKNLKAPGEPTFVIDFDKPDLRIEPHETFKELQYILENGIDW